MFKPLPSPILFCLLAFIAVCIFVFPEKLQSPAPDFNPYLEPPEISVDFYATEYNVNATTIKKIISAESGWDRFAKNPSSTAEGYCQFIDSTWNETLAEMGYSSNKSKFSKRFSIEACVYLYSRDGDVHWLESKSVWDA